MPFFIRMVANAVAILLIGYLLPQVVNATGDGGAGRRLRAGAGERGRPAPLRAAHPPLTVVTLGLFLLVINGLLLGLVAYIVPGFHVNGFLGAVVGSILLSVVSWIITRVVQ